MTLYIANLPGFLCEANTLHRKKTWAEMARYIAILPGFLCDANNCIEKTWAKMVRK